MLYCLFYEIRLITSDGLSSVVKLIKFYIWEITYNYISDKILMEEIFTKNTLLSYVKKI